MASYVPDCTSPCSNASHTRTIFGYRVGLFEVEDVLYRACLTWTKGEREWSVNEREWSVKGHFKAWKDMFYCERTFFKKCNVSWIFGFESPMYQTNHSDLCVKTISVRSWQICMWIFYTFPTRTRCLGAKVCKGHISLESKLLSLHQLFRGRYWYADWFTIQSNHGQTGYSSENSQMQTWGADICGWSNAKGWCP